MTFISLITVLHKYDIIIPMHMRRVYTYIHIYIHESVWLQQNSIVQSIVSPNDNVDKYDHRR